MHFSFEKHAPFSHFQRFLCEKSKNYPQIYLPRIINYWGSILILYIIWGAFSLVCVLSIFFFFLYFLFFSFFYRYFPWQTLAIWKDGKRNYYFSCFPLAPANEHSFNISRFLPFIFTQSICNYQIDRWWVLFFLDIYILFAFLWMRLSRGHLKVTLWGFELISNYHPSITKQMP